MVGTLAEFQAVTTRVPPSGKATQLVVNADPRRWFLRVYSDAGGATVGLLLPLAEVIGALVPLTVPAPIESKYQDAPGLTTGDWYGNGTVGQGWVVVEQLYVGG